MPSEDFRTASLPLFEAGIIEALEWNVDSGFDTAETPPWVETLLDDFSRRDRLYAHGVELSPLSAVLASHQERWLEDLARAFQRRSYRHLTDHFGFMTAGSFVRGTPLPLPCSEALLEISNERLDRLRRIAGCPVGLENLAIAFSPDELDAQAAFLRAALARAGAFLLLDLHNVHCQAVNFGRDACAILDSYPLHLVREIHVAGGSFSESRSDRERRLFRRDTHDDDTPEPVFELLRHALSRCPELDVVILERTDRSLFGSEEVDRFRDEARRLRDLVHAESATGAPDSLEIATSESEVRGSWIRDDAPTLAELQRSILETFVSESDPERATRSLASTPALEPYAPWISSWESRAVEVGISLVRQWGTRDAEPGGMLAAVLPSIHGTFELRHAARPKPGPGQVVLRVHASGLCGTDVHIREGRMQMPLPAVLGHEPVGEVEEVGEGVTTAREGDRVGVPWVQAGCGDCASCARNKPQHCAEPVTWATLGGGHATHVLVDARGCIPIPEGLASAAAAPMLCAGFTVMSGYRRALARPSDRVAILGIGGLGHLAVQVAKAFGHEVIALTSSAAKRQEILALGADEVAVGGDDPGSVLRDLGGADIVLATSSSALAASSVVSGLRPEGRLVLIGLGEGALTIDPMALILAQASVIGASPGERSDLVEVLDLCATGRISPRIETYPLVLVERAMNRLRDRRVRYRAVLTV